MDGAVQIVPPDHRMDPPGAGAMSTTRVRAPASSAVTAAHNPAIPAPQTITSTSGSLIFSPSSKPRGVARILSTILYR